MYSIYLFRYSRFVMTHVEKGFRFIFVKGVKDFLFKKIIVTWEQQGHYYNMVVCKQL